jgi:hypothetical protein
MTVRNTFTEVLAYPEAEIITAPLYFPELRPVVFTATVTVVPLDVAVSQEPPLVETVSVPSAPVNDDTLSV